jgi:hypothetical protein
VDSSFCKDDAALKPKSYHNDPPGSITRLKRSIVNEEHNGSDCHPKIVDQGHYLLATWRSQNPNTVEKNEDKRVGIFTG